MSLPTIPDISPNISLDRCDAINLLLSSIAMEEIGLSHILNAEGEKLQSFLKTCPDELHDYLKINDSINKTLRTVVKSQILLQFKLEDVISIDEVSGCNSCPPKKKRCQPCEGKWDKKSPISYCPTCKKKKSCYCSESKCNCKKCEGH